MTHPSGPVHQSQSDWLYRLLKPLVRVGLRRYYRHIYVTGLEKFPADGAVVVISNHQNAVMDPILISTFIPRTLSWLTRADVFQRGKWHLLLNALQMMPVFRSRDKVDLAAASAKTQAACVNRLMQGKAIALFPEGTHRPVRHLFGFKKGFARIIADASGHCDIAIVPIGIDYSNYRQQQAVVGIRVGDPIIIPKDSQPNINEIVRTSHEALQPLVIHGDPHLAPGIFEQQRYLAACTHWSNRWPEFSWTREFDFAGKTMTGLKAFGGEMHPGMHAPAFLELCWKSLPHRWLHILLWLLSVPAGICSAPVIGLSSIFAKRIPRDPMFFASLRFTFGWLLFPFVYSCLFVWLTVAFSALIAAGILTYLVIFHPVFWRVAPLIFLNRRGPGM